MKTTRVRHELSTIEIKPEIEKEIKSVNENHQSSTWTSNNTLCPDHERASHRISIWSHFCELKVSLISFWRMFGFDDTFVSFKKSVWYDFEVFFSDFSNVMTLLWAKSQSDIIWKGFWLCEKGKNFLDDKCLFKNVRN